MFRKKISSDALKKALDEHNFTIVRKFILENKQEIISIPDRYTNPPLLPLSYLDFISITDRMIDFPLSDFQSFVDICEEIQIPVLNLKVSNANTVLFQCILYKQFEHISILTNSKLYSFSEWQIWGEFFESQLYVEENVMFDIFHIFMKNKADLNQSFANNTVLEYIFHYFSKEILNELHPYLHTLNEYNQTIYKQNRLRLLF